MIEVDGIAVLFLHAIILVHWSFDLEINID